MFKHIAKLFLATALVAATALAQSNNSAAQRITGNWLVAITVDGEAAPFTVDMATYNDNGTYTVIASDRSEGNAIGLWQRVGDREFLSTHTQILYNEKGTFAGLAKVIALVKLNETADKFTGRYRVEVSTVMDNIVAKVTGVITGKLVVIEPL